MTSRTTHLSTCASLVTPAILCDCGIGSTRSEFKVRMSALAFDTPLKQKLALGVIAGMIDSGRARIDPQGFIDGAFVLMVKP